MKKNTYLLLTCLLSFSLSSLFAQYSKGDDEILSSLEQNIGYLASDKLEGRLTGSRGEKLAYEFLSNNFMVLGILPKGENGTFLQTFSFKKLSYSKATFQLSKSKLKLNYEHINPFAYYPLSYSAVGRVSGRTVWLGFGNSLPQAGIDDYAGKKDLKGKIFVMKLPGKSLSDPHSGSLVIQGLEQHIDTAISKGAKAVVFINTDAAVLEPDFKPFFKPNFKSVPVYFISHTQHPDSTWFDHASVELEIDTVTRNIEGHNVIGYINNKVKNTVIIGAHYDHLGYNELGGSTYIKEQNEKPQIHNGADDNASGAAALLELAEMLTKAPYRKNNYLFIAFSGEEEGLLGSNYFCKNPTIELDKVSYMINMDMLGRLDTVKSSFAINGTGTSPVWKHAMAEVSPAGNLKIKTTESGTGASDHTSFYNEGIPALHFFTGSHYDYHKPSDDLEKLNLPGELMVIKYIYSLIGKLDTAGKLTFTRTKEENTSASAFKVTLGIMPDYLFEGKGVKIDNVHDSRPAAMAGMKRGDVILKLGDETISDMSAYMKALGHFEKGQKTRALILREGKELELQVSF